MDEEPSTSMDIQRSIPQELQDDIDVIVSNHPREAEIPAALDDNKKRWLVIGICLHSVISPALRRYVDSVLTVFHNVLNRNYKIDSQIYPTHLQRDPQTGAFLNYEAVNNNKATHGKSKSKYDYTIKNAVDLSKLFLQTHMTHYTSFDETCDSSALLGLILNIAKFDPLIKSDADDVRRNIRNPWAHCDFTNWDAMKYSNSFQLMKKLVKDLKLNCNEETVIIGEMETWEINGQRFFSGTTHGFELVNELHQQTRVLAVYAKLVATETDENYTKIKNELEKFEIVILDKITNLDKDTKQVVLEINKKLEAQDTTLKNNDLKTEELGENLRKCTCHDSHNVDSEFWKEQEVIFVETPVVKAVSDILESTPTVLIVGEPGIGKSMLMHHIALKLHNKIEYSIIPCSRIQDILRHYKEDKRQMFVVDDICGRFTVSYSDIEYLQNDEDTLKRILEKGKTKIAATCRLDIYNDEKFHASCSLFTSSVLNLSANYSKEDKLQICTKYLNKTNIQLLMDQNEPFTPLMCYLYSKNENFNLTDFFHCPYESYRNEWDKVKSIDPYKYCALFLCVIHNGIIKESLFEIYEENIKTNQKFLKIIFDICGINQGTSLSKMKTVLDQIIGTYLRKTKTKYMVIHDKMFDFMCYYFGNKDTLVRGILRYADIDVVNERTQLESINEKHGKFTIMISRKYEQDYFARIKNDLQSGKLNQCFCNAQMKLAKYRASLIKVLKSIENDYQIDHHNIQEIIIKSCFRGYADIIEYFISMDVDLNNIGYAKYTPLTASCSAGNEKIVMLFIDKGCDVNQADAWKRTPLSVACWVADEKMIQLLIDNGCDVNQVDRWSDTPLTATCMRGNEKIVQILIEKGGNVNQVNGTSESPLTAACKRKNEKIVKLLIDKGGDVNQFNGMGQTPLTAACRIGYERIVQLLIEKGGNVNQVNGIWETPLTAACKRNNENIVQILLGKGGDVNHVYGMKETSMTAACNSGNEKIVQLFLDKGGEVNQVNSMAETSLTAACKRGNEKIVQLIIENGYDFNQTNGTGRTPLTAACKNGNENIVKLLIDKGCDANQIDCMGQTPLTAACRRRHEKIVQLLIDKGGNVNQVDGTKETPMTVACKKENAKIVQLLISKGSVVNQMNSIGETPLTAACKRKKKTIVQMLLDKGGNVNQVDGTKETPMTAACKKGNAKIVQLLISKGGVVNQMNSIGETPLTAACRNGNENMVQLLIETDGNVNQVDGMNDTPLTAACRRGNEKIVQILIEKGCDVNKVDGNGETPLTAACHSGNEKKVKFLIESGGHINQVDGKRDTTLTAAFNSGNEKIVQLLIDKGCDVNQVGGLRETPLTAACMGGHGKIKQLLIDKGCDFKQMDCKGEPPLIAARRTRNQNIAHFLEDKGKVDVKQSKESGKCIIL